MTVCVSNDIKKTFISVVFLYIYFLGNIQCPYLRVLNITYGPVFVGNFCFDFIVVFEFFSFLGLVGGGGLEGVLQATISVMVTSPCGQNILDWNANTTNEQISL